jgi:hypothetical protein
VHDVAVVTVFDPDEIAAGLDGPSSTCFILSNTRSMSEADAVPLNTRVGRTLFELGKRLNAPIDIIGRSDSTLRGHVIAEVTALDAVHPAPLASAAELLYLAGHRAGLGRRDDSSVIEVLRGTSPRPASWCPLTHTGRGGVRRPPGAGAHLPTAVARTNQCRTYAASTSSR